MIDDVLVGNVSATGNGDLPHARARWQYLRAVGDQYQFYLPTTGGAHDDIAHGAGAGIGINPERHGRLFHKGKPLFSLKVREVAAWIWGSSRIGQQAY